jgi:NADPH:quinone reductase-like Zn-dependent oxidoreductase
MVHTVYRTAGGVIERTREEAGPLGPHQVRVAVLAAALNFRDVYFVRGNALRAPVDGRVPLTDAVGIVEALGAGVSRFKVGERVCTTVLPNWIDGPLTAHGLSGSPGSQARDGVLAERIDIDEHALVAAPPYLTDLEAATLPVAALTAWHAVVELGAIKAGDTVLVQTTGGVSVFAIQFAAALGARVIVVSRSDEKLGLALAAGAQVAIHSGRNPDWEAAVMAHTDGIGAQLVLDMGLDDSLRRSVRALAFDGTVAIIGVVSQVSNMLDIFPVMNKNVRVRGVETGSRAMFERMNAFMAQHRIRPVIAATFDAAEIELALDALTASPFGKVVVRVAPALQPPPSI